MSGGGGLLCLVEFASCWFDVEEEFLEQDKPAVCFEVEGELWEFCFFPGEIVGEFAAVVFDGFWWCCSHVYDCSRDFLLSRKLSNIKALSI